MGGVEDLPVHIHLLLAPCPVANPNRTGVAPSGKVRQCALAEIMLPADPEHNL